MKSFSGMLNPGTEAGIARRHRRCRDSGLLTGQRGSRRRPVDTRRRGRIQLWQLKDLLQEGAAIGKLKVEMMKTRSTPADLPLAPVTALAEASQGKPGLARVAKQHAQIMVGPNVQVSKAYENRRHSEVIVAADPNHRDRLLAGSMVLDAGTVKGGLSVVAYASGDGGKTWGLALEKKAEKGGPYYADPAVAFDPDGVAYFAAMRLRPRSSPQSALEITSSRDGGHTWAAPLSPRSCRWTVPFLSWTAPTVGFGVESIASSVSIGSLPFIDRVTRPRHSILRSPSPARVPLKEEAQVRVWCLPTAPLSYLTMC